MGARAQGVSVVLCTTGERDTVASCLASLRALRDAHHEVLVIENRPRSSMDAAELRSWGAVLVHEPRQGLDVARNRGVAEAVGDIVAFVDDDCVVDPNWLAGLRRAFADPSVGFVTGRVRPHSLERRSERCFEGWFSFDRGAHARRFRRQDHWWSVIPGRLGTGCNMAFRRHVLLEAGGFDEALDMGSPVGGGGDLDMFGRLLRSGHEASYAPDALVWHCHRTTMRAVARQFWGYGVSQGALAAKVRCEEPAERAHVRAFWRYRTRRVARQVLRRAGQGLEPPSWLLAVELIGILVGPVFGRVARRRARAHQLPGIGVAPAAADHSFVPRRRALGRQATATRPSPGPVPDVALAD